MGVHPPCVGSENGDVPCVSCTSVSALAVAAASTFLLFGDGDEEENSLSVDVCGGLKRRKEEKTNDDARETLLLGRVCAFPCRIARVEP